MLDDQSHGMANRNPTLTQRPHRTGVGRLLGSSCDPGDMTRRASNPCEIDPNRDGIG
jgi:hypothetical protein